jgi:hypothetical protein
VELVALVLEQEVMEDFIHTLVVEVIKIMVAVPAEAQVDIPEMVVVEVIHILDVDQDQDIQDLVAVEVVELLLLAIPKITKAVEAAEVLVY